MPDNLTRWRIQVRGATAGYQVGDALGMRDSMCPLGNGVEERHLIEAALERQGLGVTKWGRATDEKHGHAIEPGIGNTSCAVCYAWTRR